MADPNHERIKNDHPGWCDATLCTVPEYRPTDDEEWQTRAVKLAEHVSTPVLLVETGSAGFDWRVPAALTGGGMYAWLTMAYARWDCSTYLRIGSWMGPGREMRPLGIVSLALDPRARISGDMKASGGEALAELIERGFSEQGYPFGTVKFPAIRQGANDATGA